MDFRPPFVVSQSKFTKKQRTGSRARCAGTIDVACGGHLVGCGGHLLAGCAVKGRHANLDATYNVQWQTQSWKIRDSKQGSTQGRESGSTRPA